MPKARQSIVMPMFHKQVLFVPYSVKRYNHSYRMPGLLHIHTVTRSSGGHTSLHQNGAIWWRSAMHNT